MHPREQHRPPGLAYSNHSRRHEIGIGDQILPVRGMPNRSAATDACCATVSARQGQQRLPHLPERQLPLPQIRAQLVEAGAVWQHEWIIGAEQRGVSALIEVFRRSRQFGLRLVGGSLLPFGIAAACDFGAVGVVTPGVD